MYPICSFHHDNRCFVQQHAVFCTEINLQYNTPIFPLYKKNDQKQRKNVAYFILYKEFLDKNTQFMKKWNVHEKYLICENCHKIIENSHMTSTIYALFVWLSSKLCVYVKIPWKHHICAIYAKIALNWWYLWWYLWIFSWYFSGPCSNMKSEYIFPYKSEMKNNLQNIIQNIFETSSTTIIYLAIKHLHGSSNNLDQHHPICTNQNENWLNIFDHRWVDGHEGAGKVDDWCPLSCVAADSKHLQLPCLQLST